LTGTPEPKPSDAHDVVIVHPDDPRKHVASPAFQLWERRGATDGHDLTDRFDTERQLGAAHVLEEQEDWRHGSSMCG
jgi:hypothetical protein